MFEWPCSRFLSLSCIHTVERRLVPRFLAAGAVVYDDFQPQRHGTDRTARTGSPRQCLHVHRTSHETPAPNHARGPSYVSSPCRVPSGSICFSHATNQALQLARTVQCRSQVKCQKMRATCHHGLGMACRRSKANPGGQQNRPGELRPEEFTRTPGHHPPD